MNMKITLALVGTIVIGISGFIFLSKDDALLNSDNEVVVVSEITPTNSEIEVELVEEPELVEEIVEPEPVIEEIEEIIDNIEEEIEEIYPTTEVEAPTPEVETPALAPVVVETPAPVVVETPDPSTNTTSSSSSSSSGSIWDKHGVVSDTSSSGSSSLIFGDGSGDITRTEEELAQLGQYTLDSLADPNREKAEYDWR